MKRKIFSVLFALVLVLSFSLVTAVPAGAIIDGGTVTFEFNASDLIDDYPDNFASQPVGTDRYDGQLNARQLRDRTPDPDWQYNTFSGEDSYNAYLNWRDGIGSGEGISAFNIWLVDEPIAKAWGETIVKKPGTPITATCPDGWDYQLVKDPYAINGYILEWFTTDPAKYLRPGEDQGVFSFTVDVYDDVGPANWDEGDSPVQVGDICRIWFGSAVYEDGNGVHLDPPFHSGFIFDNADWGILSPDTVADSPGVFPSSDYKMGGASVGQLLQFDAVLDLVAMAVDPMASYAMRFKGTLVDEGSGMYSGMIPMIEMGGFNVYARNGASAWFGDDPGTVEWAEVTIADHDAWPTCTPDTPDWYQYSLNLYVEEGVQKWRVANHSGATAEYPWYHSHWGGTKLGEQGVPMSGFMDWDDMYAFETDVGEYLPPLDVNHGEIPGGAESKGGGAACWDMDWSWGSESVPLQHPGFQVAITLHGSGSYSVTLMPAPHSLISVEDDRIIVLNDGWTIISTARTSDIKLVNSEIAYVYNEGFIPPSLSDVSPLVPIFVKTIGGGLASFVVDDSSQGLYSLDLNGGWNLIGIPKTTAFTYDILSPLRFTATGDVALATLASQGDYNQNTGSFYKATLADDDWVGLPILSPFDGYWAYLNAPKDFGVVSVQ